MRVAVIGAGGHAKVVLDCLAAAGIPVAGVVDERRNDGRTVCGFSVVGDIAQLDADAFVIAIGDNDKRRSAYVRHLQQGYDACTCIHPSAIVSPSATVGPGAVVLAGVIVNPESHVSEDAIVNTGARIDHECLIGAHAHVAPAVALAGGVSIGEGAFLGIGTVVLPKVSVGAWATCGAGAVVTRDVPADVTAVGVPARVVGPRGAKGAGR